MSTVTVFTAARMLAIEAASVISGLVNGSGHLILTKHDNSTIDAGYVVGPQGPAGSQGSQGAQGAQGTAGPGIATGGSAGDLLVKSSGADYATTWAIGRKVFVSATEPSSGMDVDDLWIQKS